MEYYVSTLDKELNETECFKEYTERVKTNFVGKGIIDFTGLTTYYSPDKLINFAKMIIKGVAYLHSLKIIHRDLKVSYNYLFIHYCYFICLTTTKKTFGKKIMSFFFPRLVIFLSSKAEMEKYKISKSAISTSQLR